jgi:cyanophycinase
VNTKLIAPALVVFAAIATSIAYSWLGIPRLQPAAGAVTRVVANRPLDAVAKMPGKVVLAGGTFIDQFGEEVVRLAGGPKAHMVLIPTAYGPTEEEGVEQFHDLWSQWKPGKITILHTRDRQIANDPKFVEPLKTATGVWFLGGVQKRLTDTYEGTLLLKEVHAVFDRGGVVGGNCAGAMALGETMIVGGEDEEELVLRPGLGIVPKMVADSHYLERNRIERLRSVIEQHPDHFGLGIDSETAVVLENGHLRTIGKSYAATIVPLADQGDLRFEVWDDGDEIALTKLFRAP